MNESRLMYGVPPPLIPTLKKTLSQIQPGTKVQMNINIYNLLYIIENLKQLTFWI